MDYKVIIIGSGFGGTMTALGLAERTKGKGHKILMLERGTWWTTPVSTVQDKEVGMYDFLRRNNQPVQFWSSQDHFRGFLDLVTRCFRRTKSTSLLTRLIPWFRNEDGLFDPVWMGRRTLFGRRGDGVVVARSCGVGGGSLVYSNVTIRPPDFVLDGPRWPDGIWDGHRDYYYSFAREAIGLGVVTALRKRETDGTSPVKDSHPDRVSATITGYVKGVSLTVDQLERVPAGQTMSVEYPLTFPVDDKLDKELRKGRLVWLDLDTSGSTPALKKIIPQGRFSINTGLSNILTRTARLNPFEPNTVPIGKGDPFNPRGVYRLLMDPETGPPDPNVPHDEDPPSSKVLQDPKHAYWLNRSRTFQSAIGRLTSDYGAVDLSINDLAWDDHPLVTGGKPKNYCERQGRCNIGCLPGARHTLNKQLVWAALGNFDPGKPDLPPDFPDFKLEPLCEVDVIRALDGGGYAVDFDQQSIENYRGQEEGKARKVERRTVTGDIVIVAAGTLGSTEILLRSKERGGLAGLSPKLGYGFSPNGDYVAFLEPTKERISLIKGPFTTSYGHFDTKDAGTGEPGKAPDPGWFHTIEDQGIPPSAASLVGEGMRLIRSFGTGNLGPFLVLYTIWRYAWKWLGNAARDFFRNHIRRGRLFESEEELVANMMVIAAMGRDEANATLRLGTKSGESVLRASKPGGAKFADDPIYTKIRSSLHRLAERLRGSADAEFIHPLLSPGAKAIKIDAIPTSHPLGGCIMAEAPAGGTVNALGQPFDVRPGTGGVYKGLYVADGSIVPSALGVNPSLTISALALRIGDKIYEEHFAPAGP